MELEGQQELFGAGCGPVEGVDLSILFGVNGLDPRVRLTVRTMMRRNPYSVVVWMPDMAEAPKVIAAFVKILQGSIWKQAPVTVARLKSTAETLGHMGYDVTLY